MCGFFCSLVGGSGSPERTIVRLSSRFTGGKSYGGKKFPSVEANEQ